MKIDGKTVLEAKKPLVLKITKRDITLSNTKDPTSCAAARCCLNLPNVNAARIHAARSYLQIGSKWFRFKTTAPLRQEIIAFDRGGTFEPGVYTLKPLSPWERAKGRRQGSNAKGARDKGSKNRTPSKSRAYHKVTGIRQQAAMR